MPRTFAIVVNTRSIYIFTANNEGLESLDLSWNRLRMKGAVALCAGLKVRLIIDL